MIAEGYAVSCLTQHHIHLGIRIAVNKSLRGNLCLMISSQNERVTAGPLLGGIWRLLRHADIDVVVVNTVVLAQALLLRRRLLSVIEIKVGLRIVRRFKLHHASGFFWRRHFNSFKLVAFVF